MRLSPWEWPKDGRGAAKLFLILTKFSMHPISKHLLLNLRFAFENFEPKSSNLSILDNKVLTFQSSQSFACALFRRCWFQTWHSLSVVLSSLVPRLYKPIQCLRFSTYLKKFFCFFAKSQNIMISIVILWRCLMQIWHKKT